MSHEEIYEGASNSPFKRTSIFPRFANLSSSHALENKQVQEFIHRNDLHFDIIINEEIYHDAFLMFGHKFKAPMVTICKQFRRSFVVMQIL